jgi:heme exporter protein C
MYQLANPTRFMALSARILPWLAAAAGLTLATGLWLSFAAPLDYQHGHTAKIMFIHVPSAWLAMFTYLLIGVSSFGLLVFRHPLADVSAKTAAPIGAAFTFLTLLTGSLWGKPGWGTYWDWDGRMTSVLVLLFLYLGLIALRQAVEDEVQAGRLTAVLALVGLPNLVIIKFSVDWWNSLHQTASVLRVGGPSLHTSFLWPLLIMAVAFSLILVALHMKAMRNEILRRRVQALRVAEVASRSVPRPTAAGTPQPAR